MDCARFAATNVFPSAGMLLVMSNFFNCWVPAIWYKRERKVRNRSAPIRSLSPPTKTLFLESRIGTRDAHVFDTHPVFGRLDVAIDLGGTLHQVSSYNPGRLRGL